MADTNAVVFPSASGIQAGAPFVVQQFTFVQSAIPPIQTIATGRLGQVLDAVASIIAPDLLGGAQGFVIGAGSTTGGQAKAVALGDHLINTSAAGQGGVVLLVGGNINQGAATNGVGNCVYVGWDFTLAPPGMGGARGLNVGIGVALTIQPSGGLGVNASANVVIGGNALQSGSNGVVIGESAIGAEQNTVVGRAALAAAPASQAVAIGNGADGSSDNCVAIGRRARAGPHSIAIGFFPDALGDSCVVIGRDGQDAGKNDCVLLGRAATATANGQFRAGSATHPITDFAFVGAKFSGIDGVLLLEATAANPVGNPPTGYYLYVDTVSGNLVAKGSAGTVTPLAVP
jgi:hypothetical protein